MTSAYTAIGNWIREGICIKLTHGLEQRQEVVGVVRAGGELVLVVLQVVHEHLVVVADVVGQLEKKWTLDSGGDEKARKREEGREI